ncbi:Gfo/Idh/MocA family oxidoreductase [Catenulispora sp. NF23]|uniref:Gfo/Idh/MocA family oxidoreductase n=1 Tax=Catenulispora pinistramenti TaxID=2705254 RepID=A0ABS5L4C0_9ACTN|nr:Gfo/Idh/MocA family oxidoreductase [Catenulispora pinistramenti]MBS2533040.1 Gfo/Idh/MocA family oxidoreductase [Catenulispora pinistramenti]MBS2553196.1 Gfo/Idh/MocA family oxidoreductase [Catenulispora pinistramenti]
MGDPVTGGSEPDQDRPVLRVGVVGAGNISGQYFQAVPRLTNLRITAIADLDADRAAAAAADVPGARIAKPEELYTADDVDLVLNLTIPAAHAEVAHAAIAAGKHVYGEKPLAATTAEARAVLAAAENAGVRVGCAPDTVLGTGIQTARAALDAGDIGVPVAATAFMVTPGHERWHPAPEFYYRPGGGPLLDMGPYYLTALVTLLGPVKRVVGMSSTAQQTRTIGSGPRAGTVFPVEVETHVTGVLEHANGALSTLVMSFEVWAGNLPRIEVYGSRGSLGVPDPNGFDGEVRIFRAEAKEWEPVPELGGYRNASRGYGVSDLARAFAEGRPHRADGELAFHVLDVMESLLAAAKSGESVTIGSTCERPEAVPAAARPEEQ